MLTIATLHEPGGRRRSWNGRKFSPSREEAVAKVEALTLRLFADRLAHGDDVPEVRCLFAA
jgi:hypothetical protein